MKEIVILFIRIHHWNNVNFCKKMIADIRLVNSLEVGLACGISTLETLGALIDEGAEY